MSILINDRTFQFDVIKTRLVGHSKSVQERLTFSNLIKWVLKKKITLKLFHQ